jgi:hypothetical protein
VPLKSNCPLSCQRASRSRQESGDFEPRLQRSISVVIYRSRLARGFFRRAGRRDKKSTGTSTLYVLATLRREGWDFSHLAAAKLRRRMASGVTSYDGEFSKAHQVIVDVDFCPAGTGGRSDEPKMLTTRLRQVVYSSVVKSSEMPCREASWPRGRFWQPAAAGFPSSNGNKRSADKCRFWWTTIIFQI